MICTECRHENLPGGVRCIYCGTHFPQALDFDLGGSASAAPAAEAARRTPAANRRGGGKAGLAGTLAVLALKAKSLLALFQFGKILITLGSMMVFIAVDARLFGWRFGVGIAVCILIHEMGHVIVNWRKGIQQSAPMFIPFVGALITIKRFPADPTTESESGAGGPVAGGLAALACLLIGRTTGNPFWLALANIGFIINLFNLVPFPPLDGSHMAEVFSPQIWSGCLIIMLLWAIKTPSPMLWMVLLIGFLFRLGRTGETRYTLATPIARLRMAALYLVLCIGLAAGGQSTLAYRTQIRREAPIYRNSGTAAASTQNQTADDDDDTAAQSDSPGDSVDAIALFLRAQQDSKSVWIVYSEIACWLGITLLLISASRQPATAWHFGMMAVMSSLQALLFYTSNLRHMVPGASDALLCGSLAGFLYACYAASYRKLFSRSWIYLVSRCLAWTAAGALLYGYAASSLAVFLLTALAAAVYYACHRWMVYGLASTLAERLGRMDQAIALRRIAAEMCTREGELEQQWMKLSQLYLGLGLGEPVLPIAERLEGLAKGGDKWAFTIAHVRACACILLERWDEALQCCEQILHAPAPGVSDYTRLTNVRVRLASLALKRGWPDEAIAQASQCLSTRGKLPAMLSAGTLLHRAAALADQGEGDSALDAAERALALHRDPVAEVGADLIRAQVALEIRHDTARAEKITARAFKLLPASLPVRYWRARALLASGDAPGGKALLADLSRDYPNEYWGRRATRDS